MLFKAEKTYKLIKERPFGKESTNFNCVSLGLHSLQKQSRSQAEKIKTCFFTKTNNKSRFTKSATVVITIDESKQFFLNLFFASGVGFPLYPEIVYILQRFRIIVGDFGFEPGTSAQEVWCATNEPPHLHLKLFKSLLVRVRFE